MQKNIFTSFVEKKEELMEVSFQRAIKVESTANEKYNFRDHKVDSATMAVIDTIRSSKSSVYDKETSQKIGSFLRAQIGDYNRYTGIYTRKIRGNIYIYTGKEAERAREINAQAKKEAEELEKRHYCGSDNSKPLKGPSDVSNEKLYKILRQGIFIKRDENLLKMVEDGDGLTKPDAELFFNINGNGKLTGINYSYYNYSTADEKFISKEACLTI